MEHRHNLAMLRTHLALFALLASNLTAQKNQDEFFGLDKIWDIHIEVTRDAWAKMFPKGQRTATRMFGKFSYQVGDVTIGTHTVKRVGVRMKGNATFAANGGTLKKSLKIDFNRYTKKQKFLGMGKLNLQCNALDGTQIKESVSYQVYRDCGLAAGRTCFARVFLTLKDELQRAYLGLYTVVEQVDQRFAKRTVGGGLILKPDGETLAYLGAKWNDDYEKAYHPKSKVTKALAQPLIETAALFDEPGDAVFAAGIESVLDVETFLKYTAATAILINTDSPLTVPDNYYLIVSKRSKKVVWIPWDMNWSMGEYGRVTNTPTVDLSIMRPAQKEVFRRVLEVPRFEKRYREIANAFIAGPASAEAMTRSIQRAHETVKDALAQETQRVAAVTQAEEVLGGRKSLHRSLQGRADDNVAGLLAFAKEREQSVKDQLAGKAKGRSARNLWGSNDRTVRGAFVRDVLSGTGAFDAAKKIFGGEELDAAVTTCFKSADANHSESLDKAELTTVLRRRFNNTRRRGRRRRDPSANRARLALSQLDANADGAVDQGEWKSGIRALRRFWDRDIDGHWSREELNIAPSTKR